MKRFIFKVMLFLILMLAFLAAPVMLAMVNRTIEQVKLPLYAQTLFVGDSHPQCALNDKLFPNSLNICRSAESYVYTYYKLKAILRVNPQIKTVVIGLSYHSVGGKYDYTVKKNNLQFKTMCYRYLPVYEDDLFFYLLRVNPVGVVQNLPAFTKKSTALLSKDVLKRLKYRDFPFIGSFYDDTHSNLSDSVITWTISRQYHDEQGRYIGISEMQKQYLFKIIRYLEEKQITLVFVNTPVHEKYLSKVPENNITVYNDIVNRYPNILFLNHTHLTYPDNHWRDGEHLNSLSAALYTQYLYEQLKEKGVVE